MTKNSSYSVTIKEEGKKSVDKKIPYTVVGYTHIQEPKLSILLTAKGIKEIAKITKEEDLVEIEEWSDYSNKCEERKSYGRITIIRKNLKKVVK